MKPPMTLVLDRLDDGGVRIVAPGVPGFVRVASGPFEIARAIDDAWAETDCFAYSRAHGALYEVEPEEIAPGPQGGSRRAWCAECGVGFTPKPVGRIPRCCPRCNPNPKVAAPREVTVRSCRECGAETRGVTAQLCTGCRRLARVANAATARAAKMDRLSLVTSA